MVEVFKTSVTNKGQADMLVGLIHKSFPNYQSNFDLHDCDNILRIKSITGSIEPSVVIDLLKALGFNAEVLPDEIPVSGLELDKV